MSELIQADGMVLSASPIGENDKRLVLLTRQLGKISAFARGARRQGSTLLAATNPFVTGRFDLVQGRTSCNLTGASVKSYFTELAKEQPGVYYGFYFLDLADYYGRENVDAGDTLNLLFLTMKAILNPSLDNRLVRRIFELRIMTINGEYAPDTRILSPSALYTCRYIMTSPVGKLYTFTLKEEVLAELDYVVERHMEKIIDRPLKSRAILDALI